MFFQLNFLFFYGFTFYRVFLDISPFSIVSRSIFATYPRSFSPILSYNCYLFLKKLFNKFENMSYLMRLCLPAPSNKIRHIVTCKERSTFGGRQKVYTAHGQYWSGQAGCHRFRHRFSACCPAG